MKFSHFPFPEPHHRRIAFPQVLQRNPMEEQVLQTTSQIHLISPWLNAHRNEDSLYLLLHQAAVAMSTFETLDSNSEDDYM